MSHPVHVAILDAHALSRYGLSVILAQSPADIRVMQMMSHISDLAVMPDLAACDVLLLDDEVGTVGDVSEALVTLRRAAPQIRIVVMSQMLHQGYIQQLMRDGARGFLYKGDRLEEILRFAIQDVIRDELYLSPRASALPYQARSAEIGGLSVRECRVLHMLKSGLTAQEISVVLHIKVKTVYRCRDRLKEALGARTNEQIILTAHTLGLLRDES